MVGVAALGDRAVVIVGAVVGLDAALAAEDLPAFQALVALHAAVDHAADRDRVADAVARDLVADRGDRADDLVAGDHRVARAAPVVAAGVQVAVADAGVGDLDGDSSGRSARRSNSIGRSGWSGASVPQPLAVVGPARVPNVVVGFGSRRHVSLLSRSVQYPSCLHEMRPVDHPAADRQTPASGSASNACDYSRGVRDFLGRRGEGGIDHGDLSGMDGELAGEAFAGRGLRLRRAGLPRRGSRRRRRRPAGLRRRPRRPGKASAPACR